MAKRDDRLRLMMLERLSDPDFVYRLVLQPPSDDPVGKLAAAMDEEVSSNLTDRQKTVLALTFCGMTQERIAHLLGIHQTTIHKTIHGNLVYAGPHKGRRYGGALWRLAKAAVKRADVRDLLEQIAECEADIPAAEKGTAAVEKAPDPSGGGKAMRALVLCAMLGFMASCKGEPQPITPMYALESGLRQHAIKWGCLKAESIAYPQKVGTEKYPEIPAMMGPIALWCLNGAYTGAFETRNDRENIRTLSIESCERYLATHFFAVSGYSERRANLAAKVMCEYRFAEK